MQAIEIDGKTESAWRCRALSSSIETFRRVRSLDFGTPDRVETSFSSGASYYLEVLLADRVLTCWTDLRIGAADVAGINTTAKTLQLKTGDVVSCSITDRTPTSVEQEFVQNERLIESNSAIAAGLNTLSKKRRKQQQKASRPPEMNETILWHFQQKILDQLDTKLKSAPSASVVFTLYCRDRMTLAAMSRRHGWPYRTLKHRKALVESFLRKNFDGLTMASFFVDRSIFGAAERQLQDHRAKPYLCSCSIRLSQRETEV
jgi:hypothetical protein